MQYTLFKVTASEIVNAAPETEGWLFKIELDDPDDLDDLLHPDSYQDLLT